MRRFKDAHKGKTAVVLGKGPSLEYYKEEPDSIVFGVNDVGNAIPCDYIVTTDGYVRISKAKRKRFIAIPYRVMGKKCFDVDEGDEWFLHIVDYNCTAHAAMQPKDMVSQNQWLFTASSSVQPAIHLAWYMGCTKLKVAGIDGKGGYAKCFDNKHHSPDIMYRHALRATERIARICFGDNIERFDATTITKQTLSKGNA